ncbi:hypothetical protein ACUXJU_001198 [Staphylococcus cohnii]
MQSVTDSQIEKGINVMIATTIELAKVDTVLDA